MTSTPTIYQALARSRRIIIALWGESLLPLKTIATLVHKSLEVKQQARRLQQWFIVGVALGGFVTGLSIVSFNEFYLKRIK